MLPAVFDNVRQAIDNKRPLRQSELVALLVLAQQLWGQVHGKQAASVASYDRKREYMRDYMREYRKARRGSLTGGTSLTGQP